MSKVILTNEVSGLGSAGDVVEVKNGYARNYLLPRGFAVLWSKGGEKQVAQIKAAREARALATVEEAQDLKDRLQANPIRLAVKAGVGGRLFGAVKTGDVAAAVAAAGGELYQHPRRLADQEDRTSGEEIGRRCRGCRSY